MIDRFHPLGPDADRLHDDLVSATELESTPKTSKELGSTLVLHQFLPAWDVQAYLRVADIRLHVHNSKYPAYEATGELPQLSDGNFLLPKEEIIMHLQTFHKDIDEFLTDTQRSESYAYRSMLSEKLQRVMLYCRWVDSSMYREVTRPHMKRHIPFPLNLFLPKKMHLDTMEKLRMYGISTKEQAYVIARDCYTALNTKLESADMPYFFGDQPSALDVAVFGHIVDAMGNAQLAATVHQHAPLLITLAERIRDTYFDVLGDQPSSISKEAVHSENEPNYFSTTSLDSAFMKKVSPPLQVAFLKPYRSLDWSRRELTSEVAEKKREKDAGLHAAGEAQDKAFEKGPRNVIIGAIAALVLYAVAALPIAVQFGDDDDDEYYEDDDDELEKTLEMATVEGSPVSSAKLTELGKALDQTSISNAGVESPAATHEAPSTEIDMEDVAPMAKLPAKSPKKRGRTDSLKKMLPAPASQRHKQVASSPQSSIQGSSTEEDSTASPSLHETPSQPPQRPQTQPAKLMVKDRRGSGMGVPRAHLILNAVKQAPPAKEKSNPRRWSKHEDESLRLAVERSGERNWKAIADQVPGRNHTQCLQRWTKVLKPGLIKGHWTPEEDAKLRELVAEGKKNWGQVASLIPGRTSKQCRERWCNHLDPNINKGSYTEDEDKIIVEMQAKLGNRWSIIAQQLKGRTEDAVKIRWKSLMRGRRAASKEDKSSTLSTSSPAEASTVSSSLADAERPAKPVKASPTRQRNHLSETTAISTESDSSAALKSEDEAASETKPVVDTLPSEEGGPVGIMPTTVFVKNAQTLASASQPDMAAAMGAPMHNVNELVAASIHNFQMSQRFHQSSVAHSSNGIYPGNPNQLMTGIPSNQQPPVYAMVDGGFGMNIQPQQMPLQQQHLQPQQVPPQYQYSPGYPMQQQNMGVMPNYVVPTNFPTSNQMQMHMQMSMPMPVSSSMQQSLSMPPTPTYSSQAMAMAMANTPYQQHSQHPPAVHQGFSGAPLHPRAASLGTPSGTSSQPMMAPTSSGGGVGGNNVNNTMGIGANGVNGLPPSVGGKGLNTPREEWGSSQTPRSQMLMTEGHASAYELFHQQRLRLMLQERDKQGMTLSSAPSPGQALLTKELEANKERQARQAIMQKGWKSAVDSMVSFNSVSDLSTLDDQQRFDGLLEKVSLSGLDPTDDELLDQTVDIISGDDTVDL
ncbi:Transcriptional activator Myb [Phytophthora citrophthora]|uniref:Transcriptional activator Myb n=2 Tax=Phytophthora citrophthora TaxID=4793 RepID=A0AAD9G5D9_9STRA|nr:Transcriptional activator Myb [Phytophthora citrophthora]